MGTDEQAIRELNSTWTEAVNAGELDRLLSWMADDVVLSGPAQEPFGRDRFATVFFSAHQQFRIRCESEMEEVVVLGEVAYTRCRDSLSVIPIAGGDESRLAGYRLTIWRKQPDGRWLLARDLHNLTPVEASTS